MYRCMTKVFNSYLPEILKHSVHYLEIFQHDIN